MATSLKEALRGLCCSHGWSYGVFWRVGPDDPGLMRMEEAYCEEQIGSIIGNVLHKVHRVGEGIIGQVALSGKHQWIFSDAYYGEQSMMGRIDNPDLFQDNSMLHLQFMAGIKTIAIISLEAFGVALLGSSQKILESSEFINQVKHLFQNLERVLGPFLCGNAWNAGNSGIQESHETLGSVISSVYSYFKCKDVKNLPKHGCNAMTSREPYSTFPLQYNPFSLRSQQGNLVVMPVIPSSTCAALSTENSFHFRNQFQTAGTEAQVILSHNTQLPRDMLQRSSSLSNHSVAGHTPSKWGTEISIPSPSGHRIPSVIDTEPFSSMLYVNNNAFVCHGGSFHHFGQDSNITSVDVSNNMSSYSYIESLGINKSGPTSVDKSLDLPYTIHCPLTEDNLSMGKSLSKVSSLAPQPPVKAPSFLEFPSSVSPEHAKLALPEPNLRNDLTQLNAKSLEKVNNHPIVPENDNLHGTFLTSSGIIEAIAVPSRPVEKSTAGTMSSFGTSCDKKENSSDVLGHLFSDIGLFDGIDLDQGQGFLDDILMPVGSSNCPNFSTSVPECTPKFDEDVLAEPEKGFFSEVGLQQLLDAVDGNNCDSATTHSSGATNVNSVASHKSETQFSTSTMLGNTPASSREVPLAGLPRFSESTDLLLPDCNLERIVQRSPREALLKSQVSSWLDDSYNMNAKSAMITQPKKPEESIKVARKRARPGESTRPRPKDRQQIQDRVKELREIVPNGTKCSIDALLDRTIKHMLFLQGIMKYADKLKQADEPKMIGEESGVVLKDNSSGCGGGATWAFEVAGQTMVCPILVEELNPPGQMLVEMLCEERGFFLEIADVVRGFGLTILKGVMEARESKIWARFLVEANRDVTRMDIFLSLVQLLQQTSSITSGCQPAKVIDSGIQTFSNYHQSPIPIPISLAERMR